MCTHLNGKEYNFYQFANLDLFGNKIFSSTTSIKDAQEEQFKMEKLLINLKENKPLSDYKKKTKDQVLKNAKDLFETRNKIIKVFENGTFALARNVQKEQTKQANLDWLCRLSIK